MKILHCVTDNKFIDDLIRNFDVQTNHENIYVNVNNNVSIEFKYIKSKKVKNVSLDNFYSLLEEKKIDVLFLHSLAVLPLDVIGQIDVHVKVVWISWGFDIYTRYPLVQIENKFWKRTKDFLESKKEKIQYPRQRPLYYRIVRKIYRYFFKKDKLVFAQQPKCWLEQAVSRIDYYSGVFPIEYDYLKKLSFFSAKKVWFNYGGLPFSEQEVYNVFIEPQRNNILVGQASFPQINHLDLFDIINKKIDFSNRKILVPLSYSNGDEDYKNVVLQEGEKFFGNAFYPLTTFMPKEEYMSLINNCGIALFGMQQQSGVGNILMSLWNGTKVFLPEDSMNYKYFRGLGCEVFSIQKDFTTEQVNTPLSYDVIIRNRILVSKYYSDDAIIQRILNSLKIIEQDNV